MGSVLDRLFHATIPKIVSASRINGRIDLRLPAPERSDISNLPADQFKFGNGAIAYRIKLTIALYVASKYRLI
jgi:hypothetical protein